MSKKISIVPARVCVLVQTKPQQLRVGGFAVAAQTDDGFSIDGSCDELPEPSADLPVPALPPREYEPLLLSKLILVGRLNFGRCGALSVADCDRFADVKKFSNCPDLLGRGTIGSEGDGEGACLCDDEGFVANTGLCQLGKGRS
ncbi:MAG TPA: hypothetical protein VMF65_15060 [Acidimicrobiales bacterium]|nr:hypothetical protein [Acidimicrobiales bacterium]